MIYMKYIHGLWLSPRVYTVGSENRHNLHLIRDPESPSRRVRVHKSEKERSGDGEEGN